MQARSLRRPARRLSAIAGVALTTIPNPAFAHDVRWSVQPRAPAIVLTFDYTDGRPMSFADVVVTAPDGRIYQKGNTDRSGGFALAVPDDGKPSDATWRVEVTGADAHRVVAQVSPAAPEQMAEFRQGAARLVAWLCLVSVLVNVALSAMLLERRRRRAGTVADGGAG